jgi:hypothetical protein
MSKTFELIYKVGPMSTVSEEDSVLNDFFNAEKIVSKKIKNGKEFFLVKWENFPEEESTWEPIENLYNIIELVQKYEDQRALTKWKNNKMNQCNFETTEESSKMSLTDALETYKEYGVGGILTKEKNSKK